MQSNAVKELIFDSKRIYYATLIEEQKRDPKKQFPTADDDGYLANKFADFFHAKILDDF